MFQKHMRSEYDIQPDRTHESVPTTKTMLTSVYECALVFPTRYKATLQIQTPQNKTSSLLELLSWCMF